MSALKSAILGLLLIPATMTGQVVGTTAPSTGQMVPSAQQSVPEPTSAISQTGLLPLFAVDMKIDPSWVDGNDVPSKSVQFSHSGVSDTFQQSWDALKAGGFNMIRFPVEVKDSQAAARVANLCFWARANNVSLIPILKGGGTKQKDKSLTADDVSAFLSGVVSRIRGGDAQQSAAYTQIAYFQIEGAMNHTGYYPKMTPDAAQATLLGVSAALRKAETQALQGTGVQPTPILISASFDYELIRQGAIAGVPLDPLAEQKAQTSLKQFLAPFANAANIEVINVEWFPRSISSGDVDHFAALLRELKGALPAKQLILTTGFSNAFNPVDQQTQFFTLAFSNLSDFRASDGASSTFLGAIFRQALKGPGADAAAPAGSSDPSQWNWSEKAQQLSQMWSQGGKSDELSWWLNKVADNMGLLALQPNGSGGVNVVPLPAEQAFQQISSTVAQISQNVATTAATPGAGSSAQSASALPSSTATGLTAADPSQAAQNQANPIGAQSVVSPGAASSTTYGAAPAYAAGAQATGPSSASPYQQLLLTILQQFATQMTNSFVARLTAPRGQGMQSQYAAQTQYGAQPQYAANPSAASQNFAGGAQQPTGYGIPSDGASAPTSYASAQPSSQTGSASSGTGAYPSQTPAAGAPSGAGATSGTGTYSPQPSPVGTTPTNAVSLGAQDIAVDSTNLTLGQTVHITAQVHNASTDQDISGLTVRLVDPVNATATQAMQSGVSVPRLGTTPVQLSWIPASPSTGPYQMSLQVLDAAGAQVANVPVPAITIVSASAGGSGSGTNPAQSAPAQPQIAFFGATNSNSITSPGQLSSLSVQVINPASVPTQAAQVQLFVDGTPGQTQALGPLLPKQSQSVVFTGIAASPGNHAATVTVTTADGATVSASASASAPSANVTSSGTGPNANPVSGGIPLPQNIIAVRSGAPTKFTIGAVSQSATPLNAGAGSNGLQINAGSVAAAGPNVAPVLKSSASAQTTPVASAAPPAHTTAQAPSTPSVTPGSPSTNPNLPSRPSPAGAASTSPASTGVKGVLPPAATSASTNNSTSVRPGPTGSTVPANAPSAPPQVRTITPGAASSPSAAASAPANNGNLVRPGPAGSTVPSNAPPSTPQVRTIAPSAPSPSANPSAPVRPGPSGAPAAAVVPPSAPQVRTITPSAPSPSANPSAPVRPGPSGAPAATVVPPSTPQVRTITPGAASSPSAARSAPANSGNPVRPGPAGSSVPVNAPPAAPQARTITPGTASSSANANAPVRPGAGGTATSTTTPALPGSRPGAPSATTRGGIDLVVSPGDIRYSPALRSGQTTTFTALIRNNGTAGAEGASVVFKLLVNGRQAAISAPVSLNVPARGTFLASWSTTIPAGQEIQIVVSVAVKDDKNPNKQAALSLAVSH